MNDNSTPAVEVQQLKESLSVVDNKPYLGKESAVTLFRRDHPGTSGVIKTIMLQADPPIFLAEIYVDGILIATGHAAPEMNTKTFRKVESAAVRRALENAGYGRQRVIDQIANLIGLDTARKLLGSGKAERRLGGTEEIPWSKAEQAAFWTHWTAQSLTQSDILTALAIKALGEWTKSRRAADEAVRAYVEQQTTHSTAPRTTPPEPTRANGHQEC